MHVATSWQGVNRHDVKTLHKFSGYTKNLTQDIFKHYDQYVTAARRKLGEKFKWYSPYRSLLRITTCVSFLPLPLSDVLYNW